MNARIFLLISMLLFAPALTKAAFVPVAAATTNAPEPVKHHTSFLERLRVRFASPFDKVANVQDERKPNGWAIASFVCGIVAFFVPVLPAAVLGICAIVFGVMGMKRRRNHGLAVAGFVLGIVIAALALIVGLRS